MRLACLMAGTGHRLLPLTRSQHSACLMLGERRMIDYQLKTFDRAGIGHKTFVLGHGAQECARILFESMPYSHFVVLNNPLHHSLNIDWSAWLALSQQDEPVLYYEGNQLISSSLLQEVKNHPAEICVAIDTRCARTLKNQTIDLPGEFISLVKMSAAARLYVVEQLAAQPFEGEIQLYKIFSRAFAQFTFASVDAAGRPWVRIDNPQQLRRASDLAQEIVNS